MNVEYISNTFYVNSNEISLDQALQLWFSTMRVDWKQSAFQQMLKINNITL